MNRARMPRVRWGSLPLTVLLVVLALVAACGGSGSGTNGSQATTAAPSQPQSQPQSQAASPTDAPKSAASSNTNAGQAPAPQACTLLSVADVEKISGYSGGAATPSDLGDGQSSCHIITGQGALTLELDASPILYPLLPGEKTVDLEGGAKGISSRQTGIEQDWMTKINATNFSVSMLLGGTAATIDPDKKIADLTKADGTKMTFAQALETFANMIAHNAVSGGAGSSGVVTLGDPCAVLTLDDVKQVVPDFDVSAPDYQDTTFGSKQCKYRFSSSTLQANGFATLALITQPQFDADMKNREPVSGIGDVAGMMPGGMTLDVKKGSTFIYMTFAVASIDPSATQKITPLTTNGLKQLAQKAVARIK